MLAANTAELLCWKPQGPSSASHVHTTEHSSLVGSSDIFPWAVLNCTSTGRVFPGSGEKCWLCSPSIPKLIRAAGPVLAMPAGFCTSCCNKQHICDSRGGLRRSSWCAQIPANPSAKPQQASLGSTTTISGFRTQISEKLFRVEADAAMDRLAFKPELGYAAHLGREFETVLF